MSLSLRELDDLRRATREAAHANTGGGGGVDELEEFQVMLPLEERDVELDKATDKAVVGMIEDLERDAKERAMKVEKMEAAEDGESERGKGGAKREESVADMQSKKGKKDKDSNAHAPKYIKVTLKQMVVTALPHDDVATGHYFESRGPVRGLVARLAGPKIER